MLQATIIPALLASQSHDPDVGTRCWDVPPSPAGTSWQLNPLGHAILLHSRPQKCPPMVVGRHRSCPPAEHSLSCAQGVQSCVELGTHTYVTVPGSIAPVTPRQPQPAGQLLLR